MDNLGNAEPASPVGLASAELVVGKLVTVSASKITGDRSFVSVIWEVVGGNEGHVLLACRGLCHLLSDPDAPRLLALDEFEFYAADHLIAIIDRTLSRPH